MSPEPKLLKKLRIEFTKSQARQTNDNALAESKNGHVAQVSEKQKFWGIGAKYQSPPPVNLGAKR